jgi:hypothetical protein
MHIAPPHLQGAGREEHIITIHPNYVMTAKKGMEALRGKLFRREIFR